MAVQENAQMLHRGAENWAKSNGNLILNRRELGIVIRDELGYESIPRHSAKENKTVRVYEKVED